MKLEYKKFYKNGYGISVVCDEYSYGSREGLFEIAVLSDKYNITYDTYLTDDVIGFLTEAEVIVIESKIEKLKITPEAICRNRNQKLGKIL